MLKITIPKPCHENWNEMTPNEQGRHCHSCAKTVVDFTNMTDEEVKHFFINKKEEKLCGRFNSTQLQNISLELPQNIFQLQMPLWKQFLVASLFAFSTTLFSCEVHAKGEPVISAETTTTAINIINHGDTTPRKRVVVGKPLPMKVIPKQCDPQTLPTTIKGDTIVVPEPSQRLLGEPALVPVKDTFGIEMGEITVKPATDTTPASIHKPFIMGKMRIDSVQQPKKPRKKH